MVLASQYTQYLGDSDSKCLKKLVNRMYYGDAQIEKFECIEHLHLFIFKMND
jgi:hypothetical protein